MKRIFEEQTTSGYKYRLIVTDSKCTSQTVNTETTAEFEKRTGRKVCEKVLNECNGEIYGRVFEETTQDIKKDMGWKSAQEFIKNRLLHKPHVMEITEPEGA